MASLCRRCARHIPSSALTDALHLSRRAFATTPRVRLSLPTFTETPDANLNHTLSTLREKHFIPAALDKRERKLIFGEKHKQQLVDNPQVAVIGDEEVPLQWIDRLRDIPARNDLLEAATESIINGDAKAWENLLELMTALNTLCEKPLGPEIVVKLVQQSVPAGMFGIIMQSLQQVERTGMSLQNPHTLRAVLAALRDLAASDGWSEASTRSALMHARAVALMLETEAHKSQTAFETDPRSRREVTGLCLELAAVYALRHQGGADREGLVEDYAARLMSLFDEPDAIRRIQVEYQPQKKRRPWYWVLQYPTLLAIPIHQGLLHAQKVLGRQMPRADYAATVMISYENRLDDVAQKIERDLERRKKRADVRPFNRRVLDTWQGRVRE